MGVIPTLPDRTADFGQTSIHPWQIGNQFAEHERFFKDLLEFLQSVFRSDGALLNHSVGPEQLRQDAAARLSSDVVTGMNNLLTSIRAEAARASQAVAEAKALREEIDQALKAVLSNAASMSSLSEIVQRRVERLSNLPETPEIAPRDVTTSLPTGVLGPNAGGFYGVDALGASATAQDWAQVSIDWAEHMPDTIPPNTLAITAVTGDHYSSRWWANRAMAAVGGYLNFYYYGGLPAPPLSSPTGGPITVGSIYFDTTTNQMYVYNGSTWQPFSTPTKAATNTLFYSASAGQTAFNLTSNDLYGQNVTLKSDGSQGIEVFLDGVRLSPTIGAVTADYMVNPATSVITLTEGAQLGAVLAVDVLTPPAQLAPIAANFTNVKAFTPDGTTTTFLLLNPAGAQLNPSDTSQLWVVVDGSPQAPSTNFTLSADKKSIIFDQAPAADSKIFITMAI